MRIAIFALIYFSLGAEQAGQGIFLLGFSLLGGALWLHYAGISASDLIRHRCGPVGGVSYRREQLANDRNGSFVAAKGGDRTLEATRQSTC